MSNHVDLNKLLSTLEELKVATHKTVDPSVSEKIDLAINEIKALKQSSYSDSEMKIKALQSIAHVCKALNSIAEIFKMFSG